MGLLDLFIQNKTTLDVEQIPTQGNGPVGTPTGEFNTGVTQFQQVWDSNNTYINSFTGGTNVGIQPPTLSETGLDVDNPNFIPSTTTPNTLTVYPATAVGGLGQSAVQFLQIWSPVINYNDVVVGAPTSPLAQSLPETGLDNTDPNAIPTTVSPINNTSYPNLATGEYNSVSNQFSQIYGPNNTYLNTYDPNVQPNSLDETGLDVENIGLISTTISPSTNTSYPSLASGEFGGKSDNFNQIYTPTSTYLNTFNPNTQPNTIIQGQTGLDNINPASAPTTTTPVDPTQYPNQSTGEFGGASTQYNTPYGPNNTYESTYVNSPVNFDTLQSTTLDETGLDNTNPQFVPTTLAPIDNTSYPAPPQTNLGEFNGALPTTNFTPQYNPGFGYLNTYNNIITLAGNVQVNTLGQTGLDVENSNAITFTPNAISAPTTYPTLASGEFGSVSNQYTQIWNPINQYINGYNPLTQPNTLGQTGLDNTDSNFAPTTTIPGVFTQYPQFTQGEFNGAPTQFNQIWDFNNKYIINYNPNIQLNTLSLTGLDIEDQNAAPTTAIPSTITQYPQFAQGEFNTAPNQYSQIWGPTNQYIINYNPNTQPSTLSQTGLDVEDSTFVPTTTTPSTITQYPAISTGEFGGVSTQYTQVWNPNNTYDTNFNPNTQPNTLNQTGLDIEDQNAVPTTTTPSTITQYPQFVQGEFNTAPNQYTQIWGPTNQYIINYNSNIQPNTVLGGETGLDNTNLLAFNTTFVPNTITAPTNYPQPAQTYLGEFQGAPSQFTPLYNPNPGQSYLDNYNTIISNAGNQQINTLGQTDLDNSDSNSSPTTVQSTDPTVYPLFVQGEFNSAPNLYNQIWNPNFGYYLNSNPNTQTDTLDETGLDIEDKTAAPTTYVVPETDDTVYPVIQGAFTINRIPKPYTQTYTPTNQYYSYMINNFEGQVK